MTMTELDKAHQAMMAASEDQTIRAQFYERLAEAELFVLLASEAEGDTATPDLFDIEGVKYALVFDVESRLTDFTGKPSPFAALSGRAIVNAFDGEAVGLMLNPEVAPSSMMIPPEGLEWMRTLLADTPEQAEAKPQEFFAPKGLPEAILLGLDRKLALAVGRAKGAYLAGVEYENGARGYLLAFIDPVIGAQGALAQAVSEVLAFSGVEAGALDVTFMKASDPNAAKLARVGLRFDLPQPDAPTPPAAPGRDPTKPPILR